MHSLTADRAIGQTVAATVKANAVIEALARARGVEPGIPAHFASVLRAAGMVPAEDWSVADCVAFIVAAVASHRAETFAQDARDVLELPLMLISVCGVDRGRAAHREFWPSDLDIAEGRRAAFDCISNSVRTALVHCAEWMIAHNVNCSPGYSWNVWKGADAPRFAIVTREAALTDLPPHGTIYWYGGDGDDIEGAVPFDANILGVIPAAFCDLPAPTLYRVQSLAELRNEFLADPRAMFPPGLSLEAH